MGGDLFTNDISIIRNELKVNDSNMSSSSKQMDSEIKVGLLMFR